MVVMCWVTLFSVQVYYLCNYFHRFNPQDNRNILKSKYEKSQVLVMMLAGWVVYKGYTMQLSVALAFSVDVVYWRSRVYWTNPYLFVYAFCNPQLVENCVSAWSESKKRISLPYVCILKLHVVFGVFDIFFIK